MNIAVTYSGMLAPRAVRRAQIQKLQAQMLAGPQVVCQVRNLFTPGEYRREMTIPAGVTVVGAEHRHAHLNVISRGRILVCTEDGNSELVAPCVFESTPGTKRVLHALEKTVWTTVHPNPDDETSMAVLCERYTTSPHTDLMEYRNAIACKENSPCLGES